MSIVHHVDQTLERELRQGPLRAVNAEVVFDTPNSDWAARRPGLCVNLFLHSVEEDVAQRRSGGASVVDEQGVVIGYNGPSRFFRLGYALTVWGHSPRDEHSLLGTLLQWCVATDSLVPGPGVTPDEPLALRLRDVPEGVEAPSVKLWSGLGTPARPVLDLTVTVPVTPPGREVATEPVRGIRLRARHLDSPPPERTPQGAGSHGAVRPRRNVEEIS
ncbi:DUF4255 domain-containing protein [Streptomyces lavendulae]|uniref:DUF4255 domain-containing protein n=1 Tax=Streptomyces lavendulae TaxID=1914 RepID=UPI003803B30A